MRGTSHHSVLRRGFTLIEVLIVIAILLAIGGLVVVNLLPAKGQADVDLQQVQFDQIKGALQKYKLDMGDYPSTDEGLAALSSKDALADEAKAAMWRGPYLEEPVVKDKWNHELIYHYPGELRGEQYFDLISVGPNGEDEGGQGDDITNHDRSKGTDGEFADEGDTFAPPGEGNSGGGSGGSGSSAGSGGG